MFKIIPCREQWLVEDVTSAIMIDDGKVFVARRRMGEKLAGLWEFPGGKVEEGESSEACLKREMFEEFGVDTEIGAFYCDSEYHYGHGSIRLLCYFAKHVSGSFKPTVHDSMLWVDIPELVDMKFAPADVPVVQKIISAFMDC